MSDSAWYPDEHYDLAVAYIEGGAAYYVHDHVRADKKMTFLHVDYRQAGYTRQLDQDCYIDYDVFIKNRNHRYRGKHGAFPYIYL